MFYKLNGDSVNREKTQLGHSGKDMYRPQVFIRLDLDNQALRQIKSNFGVLLIDFSVDKAIHKIFWRLLFFELLFALFEL